MRTAHLPCPLAPQRNHISVQDSPSLIPTPRRYEVGSVAIRRQEFSLPLLGRVSFASTGELPTSFRFYWRPYCLIPVEADAPGDRN
ncbi:hypothetical protein OPV22_016141 [Ensete ventricosum]|uniref:Uncharacterized protein n=1 Tax=Ensete ventricosum TaxID=4639 RepID=A0AAV8PDS7_ENSVE|nr:hypothetical protein OPV22_016141 [Ensete ventricosum]